LAISPKSASKGGFFPVRQQCGGRPARRSAPAHRTRQRSPNQKTSTRPTPILLRLKTSPILYSLQLTRDFNRNMLRLRRTPTERKPRTYEPLDPRKQPGNHILQICVAHHMPESHTRAPQNACSVPGRFSPTSEQIGSSPQTCSVPKPMVLSRLRTRLKRQVTCPILSRGHFVGYCSARR